MFVNIVVNMAGNFSKMRPVTAAKALELILADSGSDNDEDVEPASANSDSEDDFVPDEAASEVDDHIEEVTTSSNDEGRDQSSTEEETTDY